MAEENDDKDLDTGIDIEKAFDRLRGGLSTESAKACVDVGQHLHMGGHGGVRRLGEARQWVAMAPKFESLKSSATLAGLQKKLDEKEKARKLKNSGHGKPLAVVSGASA